MKRKAGCEVIQVEMHPQHANSNIVNGKMQVFGGVVMSFMDTAAAAAVRTVCRSRVVTKLFKEIVFQKPVFVGDLLVCRGTVVAVGKSSITVRINVSVVREGKEMHVTDGEAIFVAVDEDMKPIPVIGWDFKRPRIRKNAADKCSKPAPSTALKKA